MFLGSNTLFAVFGFVEETDGEEGFFAFGAFVALAAVVVAFVVMLSQRTASPSRLRIEFRMN